jgi:hypothetical protein
MKLRKKTKYEIDSYLKMFEIRENSFQVLNTLQDLYRRELLKQKDNAIEQAMFEMRVEALVKERGLKVPPPPPSARRQLELRTIAPTLDTPCLKLQIPEKKKHHPNFHRYLP